MRRMPRQKQNKGETIVEVVVAFALLLLFMSVLAGGVRFSAQAQQRARQQADTNDRVAAALRRAEPQITGTRDYSFGFKGGTARFSLPVATTRTDVTEEGKTYSFYRFAPAE